MQPTLRPFLAATPDFRSGADTPRAYLERCLAALDAWEPRIHAFVTLNVEAARAAADAATARWRDGRPLSAIDGMPLGIKDIIETADMPTQFGSPLFAGWQSRKDAACVAALRAAGCAILGKTTSTEFAMSHPFADTANPWDTARTPGGSSSGSAAAVGAGVLPAGLGTQVLGSVLRPASFCGAFGFKPSAHALNKTGSHDPQSQSCTGIIAASLADAWQVAIEIAQRAGGDPGWPGLDGPDTLPPARKPRGLALLETAAFAGATAEARAALAAAAERIEAAGVPVLTRRNHAIVEAVERDIADAVALSLKLSDWEMRWFVASAAARGIDKLSPATRERFKIAEAMTLADYRDAMATREAIRAGYAELAADCDAAIALAASGPAPVGLASTGNPQAVVPGSLLGVPALSLPLLRADGLPLGLQVLGFMDRDADAFAVASWLTDLLRE